MLKIMNIEVEEYIKRAERGEAEAQFYLGLFYEKGYGVGKNLELAVDWYRKSAEQGNKLAVAALKRIY